MLKVVRGFGILTLVAFLAASLLLSQEGGGSLIGTVTDSSQAVVPGVGVSIVHRATGLNRTVESDSAGIYRFPALPPGVYDMTATATAHGFSTLKSTGVTITVGTTTRLDLTLQVAGAAEQVTVEAHAAVVNTENAESGALFNSQQVTSLPLNGRNFLQLVSLQPGVSNNTSAGRQSFTMNGAPPHQGINLLVDGTDATSIETASVGGIVMSSYRSTFALGLDSIAEFVVHTNNYSVKYGRSSGGVIETITKSGTNELHGNIFHFFRNFAMDANSIQGNAAGLPRPQAQFNQFGGNIGGPIKRNKMFFWVGYEGLRRRIGDTHTYTVLSDAGRAAVADPTIADWVSKYIPKANQSASASNPMLALQVRNDVVAIREDIGTARWDYNFGRGDGLFVRYNVHDTYATQPLLGTPNNDNIKPSRQQLGTIAWTHIFNPKTTGSFRAGVNRLWTHSLNTGVDPRISLDGIFSPGLDWLYDNDISYNYLGDFTMARGRHNLSFGFEVRKTTVNRDQYGGIIFHFFGGPNQLYNFFHNIPDQIENVWVIGGSSGSSGNLSGYVEDSYKVTSTLTLNMGLRYDYYLRPMERYGRMVGVDGSPFPVANIKFKKPKEEMLPRDLRGWGPRLSLAWAPTSKFVVRGGWGIFVGLNYPSMTTAGNSTYVPPMVPRELFEPDYSRPLVRIGRTENPNLRFPDASFLTKEELLKRQPPPAPNIPSPDWKNQYTHQWSLRLEWEALRGTQFSAAYVGTKSSGATGQDQWNLIRPLLNNTRENPAFGDITIRGSINSGDFHSMQLSLGRRLPKGVQFHLYYMWSHSIDDEFGYSGQNDPGAGPQTHDFGLQRGSSHFDIRHDFKADYYYELPLGSNKLAKGWSIGGVSRINNGAPFTVGTGTNVGDGVHEQRANQICSQPWASSSPGLFTQMLNPSCFARPSVMDPLTGYYIGTLGRNTFTGPSSVNFDLNVTKNTKLSERVMHQFRAEAFNVWNNTNFNTPISALNNPNFGKVLTANPGRQLQLAMKILW